MTRPSSSWPETPYPGSRPDGSYVLRGNVVHPLDGPGDLLDGRVPMLAYGSNACPAKLVRLRREYGLPGDVVLTACTVDGMAAAWCTGVRRHDGSPVATLVHAPGVERHFLCWVAPDQWAAFDACEGRPLRYDLLPLDVPVRDRTGALVPGVVAYVGVGPTRLPRLRADGRPYLLRDGPAPA